MRERIRRIALFTKSALFTIIIHGVLLAALLVGLWWPYSEETIKRGSVKPIEAQVISSEEIQQQIDAKKQEEEDKKQIEKELEEEKLRLEQEKKKLEQDKKKQEELEIKKKDDEEKQKKLEEEKKVEDEKLRLKKEKENKLEEEKKRKEAEKKKKLEEEKKRKEVEKKRIEAEKKKKLAEEKRKREKALKEQLEKEQRAQTQTDAATALSALVDRIAAAVESNWRRPLNSQQGLVALIRVKVALSGEVLSANVVKSSGDKFFDQSAETAIKKASPLPFPANPKYYEFINEFNFEFSPDSF